jgi:hypothetical protein
MYLVTRDVISMLRLFPVYEGVLRDFRFSLFPFWILSCVLMTWSVYVGGPGPALFPSEPSSMFVYPFEVLV